MKLSTSTAMGCTYRYQRSFTSIALLLLILTLQSFPSESGVAGLSKYLRYAFKSSFQTLPSFKSPKKGQAFISEDDIIDSRAAATSGDGLGINEVTTDHLCIDMNQLLHFCFRNAKSAKHGQAKIFLTLDKIIHSIDPKKSLVLAFDGPAPFAKLQTQRNRRRSSPDSALFTPGTTFMDSMENLMLCYILQRYRRPTFHHISVFISDCRAPGEGEVKIINWINNHLKVSEDGFINDRVTICGSDSDILLQAMCIHPPLKHAMVLQLDSKVPSVLCNITELARTMNDSYCSTSILSNTSSSSSWKKVTAVAAHDELSSSNALIRSKTTANELESLHQHRLNLVLPFLLQGNDYLPRLRGFLMIKDYRRFGRTMKALPMEQQYLVNASTVQFNLPALWLLLRTQRGYKERSHFLPVHIPNLISHLSGILQREKRINGGLQWRSEQNMTENIDETNEEEGSWWAILTIQDKDYVAKEPAESIVAARIATAKYFLQSNYPHEYDIYLQNRRDALEKLAEFRRGAIMERSADISADITEMNDADDYVDDIDFDEDDALVMELESNGDDDDDSNMLSTISEGKVPSDDDLHDHSFYSESTALRDEEYHNFVRDSDVETYLRGLLWVIQMYITGECPDYSFTYGDRPAITPYSILSYLKEYAMRALDDTTLATNNTIAVEDQTIKRLIQSSLDDISNDEMVEILSNPIVSDFINKRLSPNNATARPLSPEATCLFVIPETGAKHVPKNLRHAWHWIQSNRISKFRKESLEAVTYEELIDIIEQYNIDRRLSMRCNNSSQQLQEEKDEEKAMISIAGSRRQRRRQVAKDKYLKEISELNTENHLMDMESEEECFDECNDEELSLSANSKSAIYPNVPYKYKEWTIVSSITEGLKAAGYNGNYYPKWLRLPLPIAFHTPTRLPQGYRVYKAVREDNIDGFCNKALNDRFGGTGKNTIKNNGFKRTLSNKSKPRRTWKTKKAATKQRQRSNFDHS